MSASSKWTMLAIVMGRMAVGAIAIGAVAVGAFAIGKLSVRRGRIETLQIGERIVDRLKIREQGAKNESS